ncbi:MAG: STAS/SEC14 domain-containing protein, partial [Saprospiraceae bacterium]
EEFVTSILALNARRKSKGLLPEESLLLKQINKEFSPKKMGRFLLLDEKRRQENLSPEEHRELLVLVRQLEKQDAQKLNWIGQLAILRKVSLDALLKQLGLYQLQHG